MLRYGLLALIVLVPSTLQAASWQTCRMEIEVLSVDRASDTPVTAKLLSVTPRPEGAECPAVGSTLSFAPESADYQSMLPRRSWPKVGEKVRWRYIHLSGICKNDGNPAPCVIKHYPRGW